MADHFTHRFDTQLPVDAHSRETWGIPEDVPLLGDVITEAQELITRIEAFQGLPERNQKLILDMADCAISRANAYPPEMWFENYWGLYVVGSRARDEARDDSDLDLLSVGTFYRDQGFADWARHDDIFDGFGVDIPDDLPSEYNVGSVDRKYLMRLTPEEDGVLPVDLNVVDLTFIRASLDKFKEEMDVAEDGSELPRTPIFELVVPEEHVLLRP